VTVTTEGPARGGGRGSPTPSTQGRGDPAQSWVCIRMMHGEAGGAAHGLPVPPKPGGYGDTRPPCNPPAAPAAPGRVPHLVVQLEPLHVDPHELGFHLEPARFLAGDDVKNHVPEPEGKELLVTKRSFGALTQPRSGSPPWHTPGQTHSPKPASKSQHSQ